mmetsp:Transcript_59430/g.173923  ORF Transcript_59430/g.173923 Transcript_59430/m.173923 type:complete len:262 (-) Transcript_59430:663-1448(-)
MSPSLRRTSASACRPWRATPATASAWRSLRAGSASPRPRLRPRRGPLRARRSRRRPTVPTLSPATALPVAERPPPGSHLRRHPQTRSLVVHAAGHHCLPRVGERGKVRSAPRSGPWTRPPSRPGLRGYGRSSRQAATAKRSSPRSPATSPSTPSLRRTPTPAPAAAAVPPAAAPTRRRRRRCTLRRPWARRTSTCWRLCRASGGGSRSARRWPMRTGLGAASRRSRREGLRATSRARPSAARILMTLSETALVMSSQITRF